MNEARYEQDFYGWTQEQARLLREGRFGELDVANIVEEIETLGRGERRELGSHLRVLLTHLLKWAYQPARRGRSWQLSIEEQRVQTQKHLQENPSLQPHLDEIMENAYRLALIDAEKQTRLSRRRFPPACPWTYAQAVSDEFWPDAA